VARTSSLVPHLAHRQEYSQPPSPSSVVPETVQRDASSPKFSKVLRSVSARIHLRVNPR
jgi:hypothetical protein